VTIDRRPLVSVVIPTYNRADKLDRLLCSLRNTSYPNLEVIVVDNAASDATAAAVAEHLGVRYVPLDRNVFCSGARAIGESVSHGEYILFVDDDNVCSRELVTTLIEVIEDDHSIGIAGPIMYQFERPEKVWCAGGVLTRVGLVRYRLGTSVGPTGADRSGVAATLDVDYLPNCFLVRRSVFRNGVRFDPDVFPHNWSEPDFALRARSAGFRTVVVPSAAEWHDVGYSGPLTRMTNVQNIYDQARSRIAFRKRHLNHWITWFAFGCIVIPISTAFFLREILHADEVRSSVKAYVTGTLDGFRQKVEPHPREWTGDMSIREWNARR